ncbi:MAG: hypothetical protein AB7F22_29650 [Reyranella sp.]|uniref:hypothetical protein n=1 Tax=Reyranella sp. TaxID=1929291 RepID=UPI003D0C6A71
MADRLDLGGALAYLSVGDAFLEFALCGVSSLDLAIAGFDVDLDRLNLRLSAPQKQLLAAGLEGSAPFFVRLFYRRAEAIIPPPTHTLAGRLCEVVNALVRRR